MRVHRLIPGDHPHGSRNWPAVINDREYHELNMSYPLAIVTGGGGHGALFNAELNASGSIIGFTPVRDVFNNGMRGRGYFNYDSNNTPRASIDSSILPNKTDENASLKVRLGGYLKEIPPCVACQKVRTQLQQGNIRILSHGWKYGIAVVPRVKSML